jgi:shikimate kinase
MKSKENLVFLGMMGSGKSSIGLLIAKKLKLDFVDVDKEIEKEVGIPIKKIFETRGEDYFRKFEEKITLEKLKFNSTVISLGGGAFVNNNIRKKVLKSHISFWLNWSNEILLNRIKNSKKRPLAFNSADNELIDLIKKRSNIYSKALYEIKCDNLSKNELVKKILKIYETYQTKN